MMLLEFRVSNFKSISDEQVLSMEATSDKELRDICCVYNEKYNKYILKKAIIYGDKCFREKQYSG
ncbi:MAG: hypothetical protein LRY50_16235, partial [Geovibrio sp.]|nr:hypothetical protein [Geovibrio sp.]